jgi:hypothetical protein
MLAASRLLVCALAVLLLSLAADAAKVQSIADTMAKWGALGTWATNCRQPPSMGNAYLRFVRSGDRVSHERVYPGGRDVQNVESATASRDGALELVATFTTVRQTRKWTLIKGPDGRIRTVANSRIDGTDYSVRDGRFVHSGAETPWLTRCDGQVL